MGNKTVIVSAMRRQQRALIAQNVTRACRAVVIIIIPFFLFSLFTFVPFPPASACIGDKPKASSITEITRGAENCGVIEFDLL